MNGIWFYCALEICFWNHFNSWPESASPSPSPHSSNADLGFNSAQGSILDLHSQEQAFLLVFFSPPHFSSVPRKLRLFNKSVSSAAHSCLTLCDPTMPGLPVHHQLLEFTQTHVHRVGDAIQPSHPLSSPSPTAFNLSQHQGLFKWVSYLHEVAKVLGVSASASVLPMNIQDWFPLGWTGWISLPSKGLSRVFSNTTVQKHQFFNTQLSL